MGSGKSRPPPPVAPPVQVFYAGTARPPMAPPVKVPVRRPPSPLTPPVTSPVSPVIPPVTVMTVPVKRVPFYANLQGNPLKKMEETRANQILSREVRPAPPDVSSFPPVAPSMMSDDRRIPSAPKIAHSCSCCAPHSGKQPSSPTNPMTYSTSTSPSSEKVITSDVALTQQNPNVTMSYDRRAQSHLLSDYLPQHIRQPSSASGPMTYSRSRSPSFRRDLTSNDVRVQQNSASRTSAPRYVPLSVGHTSPSPPMQTWANICRNPAPLKTPSPPSRSPSPVIRMTSLQMPSITRMPPSLPTGHQTAEVESVFDYADYDDFYDGDSDGYDSDPYGYHGVRYNPFIDHLRKLSTPQYEEFTDEQNICSRSVEEHHPVKGLVESKTVVADGKQVEREKRILVERRMTDEVNVETSKPQKKMTQSVNLVENAPAKDEIDEQTEGEEDEDEQPDLPQPTNTFSTFLSTTTDMPSAIMYVLRDQGSAEQLKKVPRFVKKVVVDHRADSNMNGLLFSFEFPDGSPRFGVGFNGIHRDTFRWAHQGNELMVISHRHTSRYSSDPVDLLEMLLLEAEVDEIVFEIPVSVPRLSRLSSIVHSLTLNVTFEGAQQSHLLLSEWNSKIKGLKEIKLHAKWVNNPTVPTSLLRDRGLSALSSLSLHFQTAKWIPLSHLRLSTLSFVFEKPNKRMPMAKKEKKVGPESSDGSPSSTVEFITQMVNVIHKWIEDWYKDKRVIDCYSIKCSAFDFRTLRAKFVVRGMNWKKGMGTVVRPKDGAVMKVSFDVHEFKCFREK